MSRKKKTPAARESGFGRQLRAYFARNRDAWKLRQRHLGPRNALQLATFLDARGLDCGANTVRAWIDEKSMPNGRFIAEIEALLGAPWIYLDDPRSKEVSDEYAAKFREAYVQGSHVARDFEDLLADARPTARQDRRT